MASRVDRTITSQKYGIFPPKQNLKIGVLAPKMLYSYNVGRETRSLYLFISPFLPLLKF
jgi:hypothetical protein